MQNPLANFIGVFSLVRDDRGFQVNPLCHYDITSPFPPSGNGGYVRNQDDFFKLTLGGKISIEFGLVKIRGLSHMCYRCDLIFLLPKKLC